MRSRAGLLLGGLTFALFASPIFPNPATRSRPKPRPS